MNPTLLGVVVSGLLVIIVNLFSTARSSAKIEGSVASTLKALNDRQDRHEEDTDRKFEHVATIEAKQWQEITDHGKDIAWCKAKLTNGSAGKASHA